MNLTRSQQRKPLSTLNRHRSHPAKGIVLSLCGGLAVWAIIIIILFRLLNEI